MRMADICSMLKRGAGPLLECSPPLRGAGARGAGMAKLSAGVAGVAPTPASSRGSAATLDARLSLSPASLSLFLVSCFPRHPLRGHSTAISHASGLGGSGAEGVQGGWRVAGQWGLSGDVQRQ